MIGSGSSLVQPNQSLEKPIGAGALRFEFPVFERFSSGVQLRLEAPRTSSVPAATATSQISGFDFLIRYAFHSPGLSGLGLNAGFGLQRITAFADGSIHTTGVQTVYDPEVIANVEWTQMLDGALFARLLVGTEVRASTQEFGIQIDGAFTAIQTLPQTGFRAGLGLGWAF